MAPPRRDVCDCGVLEEMADAPTCPVKFDAELNEYHLMYQGEGHLIIYYCPCCGGTTPESKRDRLFHRLESNELHRLCDLTKNLKTLQDVTTAFGKADINQEIGTIIKIPEEDNRPETAASYPGMVFTRLSEIADVHVMIYPNDRVRIRFQGKSIKMDTSE